MELSVTTTSRTSVTNVQVTALPGSKVTEAELNRIRRDLSSALGQTSENTVIPGKAFFKVTGRNASGSISLLTTVVQNIPQQKPMTLRITQTIAPDGKISGLKIDSPDPVISAMFAKLSVENLERLAGESGSNFTGVYGQPLKVSEPRQMTVSVDSQELMTSLFGAIASAANADDLIGQVQANPLTVTTTTTYQGLNAQGLHAFKQTSKYGDWKIDLSGSGDMPAIAAQLLKADTTGSQTYRKDGLPGASSQNVKMTMSMSMALDGVQVKMTMNLDQTVTMTPK